MLSEPKEWGDSGGMRLRGIIPPVVTPLSGRDELDHAGLERLIRRLLEGGVHGLFILGTTGEAPGLSDRLKRAVIERTCAQVAGQVPVVVGITHTIAGESLWLARYAAEAGASGVVAAPPYYFPLGQEELFRFFARLGAESPLPLTLYNIPSHTRVAIEPETVRRAMEIPGIVGLKDSSGDRIYFHRVKMLARERRNFSLLAGSEELLGEAVLLGADGGVCGGANLFPRLYVALYEAARAGDRDRVIALQEAVMMIHEALYRIGERGSATLKAIKCALALEGVCHDLMAEPLLPFTAEQRALVAQRLPEIRRRLETISNPKKS